MPRFCNRQKKIERVAAQSTKHPSSDKRIQSSRVLEISRMSSLSCFVCGDRAHPGVGRACKKHHIMLNEIATYEDGFDINPSTDGIPDSHKKIYKKICVTMGCLNALPIEERFGFLCEFQLKQKSDTAVLDAMFHYVALNTDIDTTMERCETMMENNEINEGSYIRTCDILKVMHDTLTKKRYFDRV